MARIPIGSIKLCPSCKNAYPNTAEFFHKDGRGYFNSICRQCRNKQEKQKREVPEYRARIYAYNHQQRQKPEFKVWQRDYYQQPEVRERERERRNSPERREYLKAYYQKEEAKQRDKAREQTPERKAERLIIHQRYKARKRGMPAVFTNVDWARALEYFNNSCAVCGRHQGLWHTLVADHWIPLSAPNCPGTVADNMIPLCHGLGGCNNRKSGRNADEWLADQFGPRKAKQILKRIQAYFEWVKAQP